MRVLYLVEGPAPYGANKSLIDLIDYLSQHHVKSMVVGSSIGALSKWLEDRNIAYSSIGHRFSTYPKADTLKKKILFLPAFFAFRALNLLALLRLIKICKVFKPDIIHTNIGPCIIGYWAARFLRIKHVWHLREYQDLDFGMRIFPSKANFIRKLNRSEGVICVTDAVRRHFDNPRNASTIYNGVSWRANLFLSATKENFILFVGRIEPTKGLEEVIRAFEAVPAELRLGHRLLIAGDGDGKYIAYLKEIFPNMIDTGQIDFLGFRSDTNLLMRKAKALIVASGNEGFGRITAEAMCNGCLVVGKDTGGTAELLRGHNNEQFGLLYRSPNELQEQLSLVFRPTFEYSEIISLAQKRASDAFCVETYGEAVHQKYGRVLN